MMYWLLPSIYIYISNGLCLSTLPQRVCSTRTCADDCYNSWKKIQTQVICTTMVSWIIPFVRQTAWRLVSSIKPWSYKWLEFWLFSTIIYIYIKWTVFVNVTTKSAQHAHARMIAIIVEKSPNSSQMTWVWTFFNNYIYIYIYNRLKHDDEFVISIISSSGRMVWKHLCNKMILHRNQVLC